MPTTRGELLHNTRPTLSRPTPSSPLPNMDVCLIVRFPQYDVNIKWYRKRNVCDTPFSIINKFSLQTSKRNKVSKLNHQRNLIETFQIHAKPFRVFQICNIFKRSNFVDEYRFKDGHETFAFIETF